MSKFVVVTATLAMLAASCSTTPVDDGSSAPPELGADEVWITIGTDAVDFVTSTLPGLDVEITNEDTGVAIAKVPERLVPVLTGIMHEGYKRCGGYVAHDSIDTAVRYMDTRPDDMAVHKAITYTIDNSAVVNPMISSLNEQHILNMISSLSSYPTRYHTSSSGTTAAVYIHDQWLSFANGRSDVTLQLYNHPNTSQPSVVMTIEGDSLSNEVVVLGAHLDSTSSGSTAPGADDDASGIATLTAVIRSAMANDYKPDRTVKFMGYAAEEVGLRGSTDIAQDFVAQGVDVVGVLQLDMTNYAGSNIDMTLIDDYTNAAQNAFVGDLIDTYVGATWEYTTCGYGCSDHASWHNNGFVASMPFEARFGQYNPNIHTSGDTLAFLGNDADHAMMFAALAAAYVGEMGKGDFSGDPGGGGGDPPPDTVTENYSDSLGTGAIKHYGPYTALEGTIFTAQTTGTGDADLYIGFGAQPTTSSSDCSSTSSTATESCTFTVSAGQNEIYVMVHGWSATTYDLTVTYTPDGDPPPPPPPDEWVELSNTDFESGWGPFSDGGGDCARVNSTTYAHQGSISARIRDNSGSASSFYSTNSVDLTGYTELRFEFWYRPNSMETGEDFYVEVFDGSLWRIVATFVSGTDFTNGSFYNPTVTVDSSSINFASNAQFRFRADASANGDQVYIDELVISAR